MKLLDILVEFRGIVQALDRLTAAVDRNTQALLGPAIDHVPADPTEGIVDYVGDRESVHAEIQDMLQRIKSTSTPEEREAVFDEIERLGED